LIQLGANVQPQLDVVDDDDEAMTSLVRAPLSLCRIFAAFWPPPR
jgi:hypothetical protein